MGLIETRLQIVKENPTIANRLAYVVAVKQQPCTDCGGCFAPESMDFDHVRGRKEDNVAVMARRDSLEAIQAEIAKCEVVCSNCHRSRTVKRAELKKELEAKDPINQLARRIAKDYQKSRVAAYVKRQPKFGQDNRPSVLRRPPQSTLVVPEGWVYSKGPR